MFLKKSVWRPPLVLRVLDSENSEDRREGVLRVLDSENSEDRREGVLRVLDKPARPRAKDKTIRRLTEFFAGRLAEPQEPSHLKLPKNGLVYN